MSEEDWGFFIDLEVDPTLKDKTLIKIEPPKIKKTRMSVIYEEDIWFNVEREYKEDDTEDELDKKENEKNSCKNSLITKTSVLIYCVICASFISLSIVLL